jgi:hypothetical protein
MRILVNLLSRTPLHNIITIKYVPPYLRGDPLNPPKGATTIVQLIVGLSRDH